MPLVSYSRMLQMRKTKIQTLMESSGVRFGTSGARGLVADMTDEVCFAYTTAFIQTLPATTQRVALAIDLRPSSPALAAACAAAIKHAGLGVDYCGAIPTPALAFYAQEKGVPGVMVTGSHIPFDRNGIKFYGVHGEITKADEASISNAIIDLPITGLSAPLPTVLPDASILYMDRYEKFFTANCLAGMKLGFYEHSSVARDFFRVLLERLGAEVISLGRTDKFVPIDTEAVAEADVLQARAWAKEHGFDAIISTDGDADRPLLGDENGNWLRGDIVGVLCAQYLGSGAVATTVSCNTAVELCHSFNTVRKTRIGSPYVIEGIENLIQSGQKSVVGFEPNGGFLVGTKIEKNGRTLAPLMTRDAVLPILSLLSMARESGGKVSNLTDRLPARYTASDRLQSFPTETSKQLLRELSSSQVAVDRLLSNFSAKFSSLDQTDGLRICMDNGEIIHFRPSGNAPELRCYAESNSQERSIELVLMGLALMEKMLGEISLPT
jgi:phosphomannomutase